MKSKLTKSHDYDCTASFIFLILTFCDCHNLPKHVFFSYVAEMGFHTAYAMFISRHNYIIIMR